MTTHICLHAQINSTWCLTALLPVSHGRVFALLLQVLQADGSLLSCALNAACAALVDAGVAMKTMFGEPMKTRGNNVYSTKLSCHPRPCMSSYTSIM